MNTIAFITLGILLVAIAMATAITVLIERSITGPILHLAEVTRTIADTGDLEQHITVKTLDETGQLATTFNRMITHLRQTDQALKKHSEHLEEMVEERTRTLEEAQEQLVRREKLAILGQWAGGVGHELRNPLGVISNAVYYLKMTLSDADQTTKEYLDMISSEVRNSTKIVSDLLDFSRTRPAQREESEVPALVIGVLDKHPPPEEVQVITEIAPDLPAVFVDPQQIEIVLGNLLTNAYQAMTDGGLLTLTARTISLPQDRGRVGGGATSLPAKEEKAAEGAVSLSITDTGRGIPVENMKKIFEPLFTTKGRGIGLGLALSRNLVEANGGTIEVESQEGEGSTFTIILPVKEQQHERTIAHLGCRRRSQHGQDLDGHPEGQGVSGGGRPLRPESHREDGRDRL